MRRVSGDPRAIPCLALGVSPRRLRTAIVDVAYAVVRRGLRDSGVDADDELLVDDVVLALLEGPRQVTSLATSAS